MKKIFTFLAVFLCLSFVFSSGCFADTLNYQGWLYEENADGSITIVGYEGNETELYLPSMINGKAVKEIAANAFKNNKTIKAITLPEGLVKIGENAFEGCEQLKTVFIPVTVEEIGADVFKGCTEVTVKCIDGSYTEEFYKADTTGNVNVVAVVQNAQIIGAANSTALKAPDGIAFKADGESYVVRMDDDDEVIGLWILTNNEYKDLLSEIGEYYTETTTYEDDYKASIISFASPNTDYAGHNVATVVIFAFDSTGKMIDVTYLENYFVVDEERETVAAIDQTSYAAGDGSIVGEVHVSTNEDFDEFSESVNIFDDSNTGEKLIAATTEYYTESGSEIRTVAQTGNVDFDDETCDSEFGFKREYFDFANARGFSGYDWFTIFDDDKNLIEYNITEYVFIPPSTEDGTDAKWNSTSYYVGLIDETIDDLREAVEYDENGVVQAVDTKKVFIVVEETTYTADSTNPDDVLMTAVPEQSEGTIEDHESDLVTLLNDEEQKAAYEEVLGEESTFQEAKDAINPEVNPGVENVEGYEEPILDPVIPAAISDYAAP